MQIRLFSRAIQDLEQDILEDIGQRVEKVAKELCPTRTGRMRDSIVSDVRGNRVRVRIENTPYSKYQLYGTRGHEAPPRSAMRFEGRNGDVVYTRRVRGIQGRNFMREAFDIVFGSL